MTRSSPGSDIFIASGAIRETLHGSVPDLIHGSLIGAVDVIWSNWVAATLMHELGHALGLLHGGGDLANDKPNYLSLMNYAFYPTGIPQRNGTFKFDYSMKLPDLNENHLIEARGIGDPNRRQTFFNRFPRADLPLAVNKCVEAAYNTRFLPSPALDWDCNGKVTPTPVQADINGDSLCVVQKVTPDGLLPLHTVPAAGDILHEGRIYAGDDRICSTEVLRDATGEPLDVQFTSVSDQPAPLILSGFNDWNALDYGAGGNKGQPYAAVIRPPMGTGNVEPPIEKIMVKIPPGLIRALVFAPHDVITVSPAEGEPPLVVTFDGTASTAFDGKIVKWEWDFGDNNTGSGSTVTHTYTRPGDYFATLTVTDDKGRINTTPLLTRVSVTGEIQLMRGDLNGDNIVDLSDLDIITRELNTPATGPTDPSDLNGDGTIDALDARSLVNLCTYPHCASTK